MKKLFILVLALLIPTQALALIAIDAEHGKVYPVIGSISSSGTVTSGTAGEVAYYSDLTTLDGEAAFAYDATTNILTVGSVVTNGSPSQVAFGNGYYINGDAATLLKIGSSGGVAESYSIDAESASNAIVLDSTSGVTKFQFGVGGVQLGQDGTDGKLIIYNELGATDYLVTMNPSASQTGSYTLTLPVDDGASGQALLTDGSGVMSWGTPGAAPAGVGTEVQYRVSGSALGAITNTSTDGTSLIMTSPKVLTGINDTNGNELFKVTATASAVNELTVANAATGGTPTLSATGGDTNISIALTPKGTGGLIIDSDSTLPSNFTSGVIGAFPAAETIIATGTITADACGGMKRITAAGAVTTNTTDTFTAPASGNASCIMYVVNTGANNITLDNNAHFKSASGADVVMTPDDAVLVGSSGGSGVWYQLGSLVAN